MVVAVDPARGWALADRPRRVAAVLALPLTALLVLLGGRDDGTEGAALLLWTALGPASYYSLARVLRPEPRHPERTPRHLLAATATSFGVPTVAALALLETGVDGIVIGLGTPAFALGVVTLLWGLFAAGVRALAPTAGTDL